MPPFQSDLRNRKICIFIRNFVRLLFLGGRNTGFQISTDENDSLKPICFFTLLLYPKLYSLKVKIIKIITKVPKAKNSRRYTVNVVSYKKNV